MASKRKEAVQLDLFTDYEQERRKEQQLRTELAREKTLQKTVLEIKKRFGKNAILKGLNFDEGATAIERNKQIGGHAAGLSSDDVKKGK